MEFKSVVFACFFIFTVCVLDWSAVQSQEAKTPDVNKLPSDNDGNIFKSKQTASTDKETKANSEVFEETKQLENDLENDTPLNTTSSNPETSTNSHEEESLQVNEEDHLPLHPYPSSDEDLHVGNILLVSLGGGEDEVLISQIAWLFYRHEKKVTVLLYGDRTREETFPQRVKIIRIPVDENDPLRPDGTSVVGLTPDDSSRGEWVSGRILWSRIAACRRLVDVESTLRAMKPSIIVSPLFLHDVCVLALAHTLEVPVVGILTSRVGAWWVWAQLGVLPSLSSVAVPLTSLREGNLWDRTSNIANHYSYMSNLRQLWQVRAMTSLPQSWNTPSLVDLYAKVSRLLYSWDPVVDALMVPVPSAIPVGGFASTFTMEVTEDDVLASAVMNRAGIVVFCAGSLEVWVGSSIVNKLKEALQNTHLTVIWKATHSHLLPNRTSEDEKMAGGQTKFLFAKKIPLNDVLNHPRHRLLVSTCGESEVMAAVHFGSPLLCLPVTTDQHLAAKEVQRLGMGEFLLATDVSVEKAQELIQRVSSDRRYRLRARELAEDLHDQPLTPSERLLFHVENVVRKPLSVRYKICGSSLSLLQQTNADVYLVGIVFTAFIIFVLLMTLVNIYPYLSQSLKMKKD